MAVRPHARRTGADRRRERDAPVRRAADRLVAVPQGSRFDRRDDGPLAEEPGEARREIRAGHDSLRRRATIGRRHEKIPFPDSAGPLHRVGLHPRRRPGDALRLVAIGLPDGLPFLHDRAAGFRAPPDRRGDTESDPLDSRKRPADQRRLHGHGRAARQRGAGHPIDRGADLRLGIRLEPDADHRVDGRRDSRHAGAAATDPGASGRQPARPDPRRARSHDALRQGNGSPAGRKESPEASGSEPHETSSDAHCGTTIAPERTEPDNKKTIP